MSTDRIIREAIEQLSSNHLKDKVMLMFGNVSAIQTDSSGTPAFCTVTPISENATTDLENVALQADISDGEIKVPVIGSTVIVGYSIRNTPFLAFVSDIDAYYYWGDTWQLGDGSYGGWVRGDVLTQQLNTIQNSLNTLMKLISTWTPVPNDGGASLKTLLSTWATQTISLTSQSQISNSKATHGVL